MSVIGLSALLGMGVGGCGNGRHGAPEAVVPTAVPVSHTTATAGPAGASFRILSPRTGEVIGSRFTARVALAGFRLSPSLTARTGDGSLRFSLDGGRYDEPRFAGANGEMGARLSVNGFYSPADRPQITYAHVPDGRHVLSVSLMNRQQQRVGVAHSVAFVVR